MPRDLARARHTELAERILARRARRVVLPPPAGESFRWYELDFPARTGRLTVHPEFEVQLIRQTRGQIIIGDRAVPYVPGQIALIGANVPHAVAPLLDEDEVVTAASAVAHFSAAWFEGLTNHMPELLPVLGALTDSSRGIILSGAAAQRATWEMEAIGRTRGVLRVGHLLGLLGAFVSAPKMERRYVASTLFSIADDPRESTAADAGLAYILDNLSTDLSLAGAAIAARMSESAFSRHFKQATGSTFSDTVRALRIAQACRLLERTDSPVSTISEQVGYHNLSNFNRQFLAVTGVSPATYRRRSRERG